MPPALSILLLSCIRLRPPLHQAVDVFPLRQSTTSPFIIDSTSIQARACHVPTGPDDSSPTPRGPRLSVYVGPPGCHARLPCVMASGCRLPASESLDGAEAAIGGCGGLALHQDTIPRALRGHSAVSEVKQSPPSALVIPGGYRKLHTLHQNSLPGSWVWWAVRRPSPCSRPWA